ncbi:hypothetical protein B0H11DRAFT_2121754 [Mycena galericulata]|nr:hypothetical protein B0H11DRAFT_2121754 [Mycena galericulata]
MVQLGDPDKRSTDGSISSDASDTPTLTEQEWEEIYSKVQKKLREYKRAQERGDKEGVKRLVREIGGLMRSLAEGASDPEKRADWKRKAEEFDKASESGKENMLMDIGVGLGIIIASPFLLAGGILYGVGRLTQGLGNLLTGGNVGKFLK